jgi:serine/threonine-protein kinase
MNRKDQVLDLLEEMLDSGRAPEEVCRDCPELLAEVQQRWKQFCRIDAEVAVLLPEQKTTPDSAPPPPAPATGLPQVPGYEVEAVLGRGGIGVVYKARHLALERIVAVKMLLTGTFASPEELARFQREAVAVAGLRHPNIVQVYDAGTIDDRPYFTMEFVEGGSLAQQVAGMPQAARQAAVLVATLAEAVQVAHLGGIIHRDLKPGNILLTRDGIPKISDFGLARRLQDDAGLTISGAPLGTPSYMAPEQARGKVHAIGPAADVYALGAILYQLLTGRPPFRGETSTETMLQVVHQEPVPPARLNAKVPRDLETICLKCLHKEPPRRYASAAALAEDLRCFVRGEAIAARPEGRLERLARGMRRRPALVVAVTATVLLIAGGLWLTHERAASELATKELDRVNQARHHQEFVARLDAIRLDRTAVVDGTFDTPVNRQVNRAQADRAYEAAFREAGFGEVHDDPEVMAARLAASNIRKELAAALDDWVACVTADQNRQNWLLEVARRAGPDPTGLRDRLHDPAVWKDRAALTELARTALAAKPSVQLLVRLGERLRAAGGDAVPFLTQVQQEHADDFWANFTLAEALGWNIRPAEAIRYYQAALAIRPRAAAVCNNLGRVLAQTGQVDEAMVRFQQAIDIDHTFAHAHSNLGLVLRMKGQHAEALEHFQQAVRFAPHHAASHSNLGTGLTGVGRWDEANEQFQEALRLDSNDVAAHSGLGQVLKRQGRLDEAIDHDRTALRLDPRSVVNYTNLGDALLAKGQVDEALKRFEEALALDPKHAMAHAGLGNALWARGRRQDAIDHFQEALRLDSGNAQAHNGLGNALTKAGRPAEAIEHFRQAIASAPMDARMHFNLAFLLAHNGGREEAIGLYQQAVRLDPSLAEAHGALGLALLAEGRFREARDALRRCLDLLPPSDKRREVLLQQLQGCDHFLALEQRLPAILEGKEKPASTAEQLEFAELCRYEKRYLAAAQLFAAAFAWREAVGEMSLDRFRYAAICSAALAGCGCGEDAARTDATERSQWRALARVWLREDLALFDDEFDGCSTRVRDMMRNTLTHWRRDPTLAGLRDPDQVAKWPAAERKHCLALWKEVDRVLERTRTAR